MNMIEDVWRTRYCHPTQWDQAFAPLTLPDMFLDAAERHPDAPFLDFLGRPFSYADVAKAVRHAAAGFEALGIKPGDRVGLFLPNVPHYVAAYYGALLAGAIVVNFSPLYTVDKLAAQARDSGTRLIVTLSAAALLPTAMKVLETGAIERLVVGSISDVLPPLKSIAYRLFKRRETAPRPSDARVTRFSQLLANDGACSAPPPKPEDVALIQYTGGTTGIPKGAMLTHQNLTANARQVHAIEPGTADGDRIVGVLPFFHVFANTCVLNRTVFAGGLIAMLPRFDAKATLQTIARVKATALPGVPTMYQALLDHPETARTDFSSLRVCISGGAPLPAEVEKRFEQVSQARLIEGYGLTESAGVVSTNPYEGEGRPGTIGQPLPGTRVRVLDREDPTKPAPDGEPGELAFAGPQTMKGYWNHPEVDADIFVGE